VNKKKKKGLAIFTGKQLAAVVAGDIP